MQTTRESQQCFHMKLCSRDSSWYRNLFSTLFELFYSVWSVEQNILIMIYHEASVGLKEAGQRECGW